MSTYTYSGSSGGGIFQQGVMALENLGVLDVIVPFILVFTIVFAVLQKTKILGVDDNKKPRKNFNVVIALVMSLAVIIPHVMGTYPYGFDVVDTINNALPNVSLVLIAVIMMLLIIGVFGGEVNIAGSSLSGWAVLFSIVATIFIFVTAGGWWWFDLPPWLNFLDNTDTQALVVVILVFALVIYFITKEDKPKEKPSWMEQLGKVMSPSGK